jgi:hypothetical protein
MARRKAQNPYGSCLAARGRLAARQSRRLRQRAPLSLEGRKRSPPRYISQLLAGTPSGPGGSPDAARVPCCARPAGAAPRPAYRNASRERPLEGRGGCSLAQLRGAGIRSRRIGGYTAGTSGAAPQVPRGRRSAARILMDEGWVRLMQGGDVGISSSRLARSAHRASPTGESRRHGDARNDNSPSDARSLQVTLE